MTGEPLLSVADLRVVFPTRAGIVRAVNDVSLAVSPGETLGIVGESGSGKSVTAQAVLGLLPLPGRVVGGEILWRGKPFQAHGAGVRGKEIACIFQDPMQSLNPLMTIGAQLVETLRHHARLGRRAARDRAAELLAEVALSAPARRLDQYPHELSGGILQRVMLAMALACEPRLIIADEPTTALDVTIQAEILALLSRLQRERGLAILLITHDLGIVAGLCHRVAVMYAGRIVETGEVDALFARPAHPYTQGLLRATPTLEAQSERLVSIPGAPPALLVPPAGCPFRTRCPIAARPCETLPDPARTETGMVVCWRAGEAAWADIPR
ncbi:peptide/nickel transport system ATP-binding protein [Palleronia aestuarii]|uniref:Peptide/nickel transport system ATP-binding protein n=1 Tax=Palleronia aestuarii TaxID=568105 RepID=A0A2W7NBZ8_9RHOB|nr:ABC transporter ATP-binding protein [Palleronia aestuarii]PZX17143.1 peptide/nickel transport system ATP-binding protein [Palleronia aestuarii]